jgi:hypothetical protein
VSPLIFVIPFLRSSPARPPDRRRGAVVRETNLQMWGKIETGQQQNNGSQKENLVELHNMPCEPHETFSRNMARPIYAKMRITSWRKEAL